MHSKVLNMLARLTLAGAIAVPFAAQAGDVVIDGSQVSVVLTGVDTAMVLPGANISWLDARGQSQVTMTGGDVSWLHVYDQASVTISGADDISWLIINSPDAAVEIQASNVSYAGEHLSGVWANGQSFNFWALYQSTLSDPMGDQWSVMPSNITITAVPEPGTWALMSLGLLGVGALAGRRLK